MRRKNFIITSDAGHRAIAHAWNSSPRTIERLVREVARSEKQDYERGRVDVDLNIYRGSITWTGKKTGRDITFSISLQAQPEEPAEPLKEWRRL